MNGLAAGCASDDATSTERDRDNGEESSDSGAGSENKSEAGVGGDDMSDDAGGDDMPDDDVVEAGTDDTPDDDADDDVLDDDTPDDDVDDDVVEAGLDDDVVDDDVPENVGMIEGRVVELDGTAVTDVMVEAAGVETQTDNRGIFALESIPEGEIDVFVRAPTHSGGHARVTLSANETVGVQIRVIPLVTEVLPDAEAGGTMIGADGVEVTLPGGSLLDANGDPVSGAVDVNYVLVNTAKTLAAAPGGMMAADDSGNAQQLESFGMVDISFSQDGEPLTFEGTAELRFPLAADNPFMDGDSVGLFSFDEEQGIWVQEGEGMVENGEFVADVDHFSWWNCDQPLSDKSCLTGMLQDDTSTPMEGTVLSVTGVDYLTNLSAVTDADGAFCVSVKRDSSNRLSAFGGSVGSFYGLDVTAQSGTEATTCELGGCVDVGILTAERLLTNCQAKTVGGADHVYVMSSGDATLDTAVKNALEGAGQTITLGVQYTQFEDVDLSPYDAVYLQANSNWSSGDMPLNGQVDLVDWVNCGGGLVATEWVLWKTASGSYAVLDHTFPAVPTTSFTSSAADIVYSEVTADPIMNAGVPEELSFVADNFAGTETDITPRPGSVVFYDSVNLGSGVVGWDYNHGRVINISTVAGPGQLMNADYIQMLSNSFDWVRDISR